MAGELQNAVVPLVARILGAEMIGTPEWLVCKNTDYLDWDAFGHALADHVRHRNSPDERKRRKLEAAKRRERQAAETTSKLKLAA